MITIHMYVKCLWSDFLNHFFKQFFRLIFYRMVLVVEWKIKMYGKYRLKERETRSMQYNFIWLFFLYYSHWLSTAFSSTHISSSSMLSAGCLFGRSGSWIAAIAFTLKKETVKLSRQQIVHKYTISNTNVENNIHANTHTHTQHVN